LIYLTLFDEQYTNTNYKNQYHFFHLHLKVYISIFIAKFLNEDDRYI